MRAEPVEARRQAPTHVLKRRQILGVMSLLLSEMGGLLGVHPIKEIQHLWIGESKAAGSEVGCVVGRFGLHVCEEGLVATAASPQVRPNSLDRILQPPVLKLVGEPVFRWIV